MESSPLFMAGVSGGNAGTAEIAEKTRGEIAEESYNKDPLRLLCEHFYSVASALK